MGHLPSLRRDHQDRLVLDSAQQVTPVLIALARTWRDDPIGFGALLTDIADRDDAARAEAHLDGLGDAEHVRDQLADRLLATVGGAQFRLDRAPSRHAAHQARRIAEEARLLADLLDQHANLITMQVEELEQERAARQTAEIRRLRAVLAAAGLPVANPLLCGHCNCWRHHANGLPCCIGCGAPGHAMTAPEARPAAHAG
ncbi:hypothetical protein [Streptomyces sp. H51]|uniref:hypothetical protein n=1 Tax=Streptomyces sp. H51 TaxID=3111770 RepID=UPI002D799920|nr:hypothetical protein [Streptomyces sp. H51]